MQKNLSEEQRQRDQCPAIEWVLDNQEVKSEEKILSLLPRSAKWNKKTWDRDWEMKVKWKWLEIEIEKWKWNEKAMRSRNEISREFKKN